MMMRTAPSLARWLNRVIAAAAPLLLVSTIGPAAEPSSAPSMEQLQTPEAPEANLEMTFPVRYVRRGDRWWPVDILGNSRLSRRETVWKNALLTDIGPISAKDWDEFEGAQRDYKLNYEAWQKKGGIDAGPPPAAPRPPAQTLAYLDGLRESNLVSRKSFNVMLTDLDLKGKRVLIVPTRRAAKSMETIELLQKRIVEWSNRQRAPRNDEADIRAAATLVSELPAAKLLAATFVPTFAATAGRVGYAEDLKSFAEGGYDYVVLVDVNFAADIDRFLAAQDMARPPNQPPNSVKAFEGSLSWVLLDRDFDVVAADIRYTVPFRSKVDSRYGTDFPYCTTNGCTQRNPKDINRDAWRSREIRNAFWNLESGLRMILGSPYVWRYLDGYRCSSGDRIVERIDYDWEQTKTEPWGREQSTTTDNADLICVKLEPGIKTQISKGFRGWGNSLRLNDD